MLTLEKQMWIKVDLACYPSAVSPSGGECQLKILHPHVAAHPNAERFEKHMFEEVYRSLSNAESQPNQNLATRVKILYQLLEEGAMASATSSFCCQLEIAEGTEAVYKHMLKIFH